MKNARQADDQRPRATVLAVDTGAKLRVLSSGRSIQEAVSKAQASAPMMKEPTILFVPRRDAIHVF